jgi:hypothetical protein
MLNFGALVDSIAANYRLETRKVKSFRPLAMLCCNLIEEHWTKNDGYSEDDRAASMYYSSDMIFNDLHIDMYLGKNDSMKDVHFFIDELEANENLEFRNTFYAGEQGNMIAMTYVYTGSSYINKTNNTSYPLVSFWIHLENSNSCKLVPTGDFKEIMRYECG